MEIAEAEKKILAKLIFHEPYKLLQEELDMPAHITKDILKQLVHHQYVSAYIEENNDFKKTISYDNDVIDNYFFKATAKGLNQLI